MRKASYDAKSQKDASNIEVVTDKTHATDAANHRYLETVVDTLYIQQ